MGSLSTEVRGVQTGDPVGAVHAALARRGDWLLVFDNVADPAAVRGLLPPAGGGRVVITSQHGAWPAGQALEVPVLDRDAAAGFVLARASAPGTDERAAGELAGELGGLPLALEQAAAYMRASGRSVGGYLELFRARRAELLGRGEAAGYDKQVATTWSLALAAVGPDGPAAGLLRLAACCAAEDIPLDLLLRPGPGWRRRRRSCWGGCWMTILPGMRRWHCCGGIRWSASRAESVCRCTGWSRRSRWPSCPCR